MILLVSRRLAMAPQAYRHASAQGDVVTVGHGIPWGDLRSDGTFADALRLGLDVCGGWAVKWDDDNIYPPGYHDQMMAQEQVTVGRVRVRSCDRWHGTDVSLCASLLHTSMTLEADASGRVGASVPQSNVVDTGVVKQVCHRDWSWADAPTVRCGHG